jgi:Fe-S cluster assembly protein SufD
MVKLSKLAIKLWLSNWKKKVMTGLTTNLDYIKKSKDLNQRTGEPQAFALLRSFGQKYLETNSWPSRKNEDWRYTSTAKFSNTFFEPHLTHASPPTAQRELILNESPWSSQHVVQIVFLDGVFQSNFLKPNTQLRVFSIKQAIEMGLYPIYDLSKPQNNFEALNLSFLENGIFLDIPADSKDTLIEIKFMSSTKTEAPDLPRVALPRVVVKIGSHARATLFEQYDSHSSNSEWTNSQIEVHLESQSELNWARLQNEDSSQLHTCRSFYYLKEDSKLHLLLLSLGALISRHDLSVSVIGERASSFVHGVSLGTAQDHRDHNTVIDFKKGLSTAEQIFKSILSGESKSIFNGKIVIRPDSQKVNSSQLNQSLLLSEMAEATTQPQLEIYADDVKAIHGATIGQLNNEELFYFKSRGISERRAKLMMTEGFALDLIEKFPNQEIKNFLKQKIKNKLQGFW